MKSGFCGTALAKGVYRDARTSAPSARETVSDTAIRDLVLARPFLRRITAQGFRGIGPEATLDLTPGPGLTLVVGRNGSGKSSFAEGLELLLTGDTYRWSQRSKVWRDGWRNLHHPGAGPPRRVYNQHRERLAASAEERDHGPLRAPPRPEALGLRVGGGGVVRPQAE